jgi:hypothetical protein
MAELDVGKLLKDIGNAARPILQKDLKSIEGFSQQQLRDLAAFAAMVVTGITTHQISEDAHPFLRQTLQDMTQHFVDVLKGLIAVTVEKLVNAIIDVAVKAIETAAGVTLRAA